MLNYLKKWNELVKEKADKIVIRSAMMEEGITYRETEYRSGKIYNWLKKHNIGKNDMVMICLPRGARIIISVIAILKVGAAFVIVESNYPEERINFIKKDCDCKIVIDEDLFFEMMNEEYLEGCAEVDLHDPCFAVYTSGTTGSPKGVLHEYGKIDQIIKTVLSEVKKIPEPSIFAYGAPFSFVAFLAVIFSFIYDGKCIFAIENEVIKNPIKLCEVYEKYNVTDTFFPPSLVKLIEKMPKSLINIIMGGDKCDGVYRDDVNLYTYYCSSESAFMVSTFTIDKKYEKVPIGKNKIGVDILILDEEGKELSNGEIGEICFKNEYTRGYINLPEKTKEAFANGLYHMGDLGYKGNDGNYYVCGRKDDMIKINGNRIEPGEIENVIRKIYNIKNVIAKGFINDKRAYICAYLLKSELEKNGIKLDQKKLPEEIKKFLPYYMVPTYYIELNEFPLNQNGKIDRKSLKEPSTEAFAKKYVAYTNDTEKYFCELFEKVLGVEKVSIDDDFYLLGGDSLSSMKFISECKYNNFGIEKLYEYRTPKEIAKYCDAQDTFDIDKENTEALANLQDITAKMQNIIDCQEHNPNSTAYNILCEYEVEKDIDIKDLKNAVDKVLRHHPVFNSILIKDKNNKIKMKYEPSLYKEVEVIELSDEEFEKEKSTLCKPYNLYNNLLYNIKIYKTNSKTSIILNIHHAITDGTTNKLILRQIMECTYDKNYELPKDYYYLNLSDYKKDLLSEKTLKVKENYQKKCEEIKNTKYNIVPTPDLGGKGFDFGYVEGKIDIDKNDDKNIVKKISSNVLFMAAYVLTITKLENVESVFTQWINNGRNSTLKNNQAGLLICSIPLFAKVNKKESVAKFLDDIKNQINYGIANANVHYDFPNTSLRCQSVFILQKDIISYSDIKGIHSATSLESKRNEADSLFEFGIVDNSEEKGYEYEVEYAKSQYSDEYISNFLETFINISKKLCYSSEDCLLEEI